MSMVVANHKNIIIGNWKMNLTVHDASVYLHHLAGLVKVRRDVEVVLAPTTLALQSLSLQIDRRQFKLAAQNCYWRDHGAFTGEVSASQLHGIADYVIVGHSERRHVFHETERDIRRKVQAALRNNLTPVLCVGETSSDRSMNETADVLRDQLTSGLANVTGEELERLVIAYEPVWAIGTGDNATPHDVASAERVIRREIAHLYGKPAAAALRVLYGGSVTADSARGYVEIAGIDGLLVGGASLDAHQFAAIIEAAHKSDVIKK